MREVQPQLDEAPTLQGDQALTEVFDRATERPKLSKPADPMMTAVGRVYEHSDEWNYRSEGQKQLSEPS